MGTTLRTRPPEEKAQLTQAFAARIVPYLAAGTIRPVVDRTFPLEQVGGGAGRRARARQARQAAARAAVSGSASSRHHRRRLDRPGPRAGDRRRRRRRAGCRGRHRPSPGRNGDRRAARRARLRAVGGDAGARAAGRAVGVHAAAAPPRPGGGGARGRHPRLPREADRPHDGRRRGDRPRRAGGAGHLRRRLPVARHGAAGRGARGACRADGGHAARPKLRAGGRAGRGSWTRPRAAARSWSGGATTSTFSGRSPARSSRCRWRSAPCASPRPREAVVDRRRDLAAVPLRRAARWARCTRSGRGTASRSCTPPMCWPARQRSASSSARRPTGCTAYLRRGGRCRRSSASRCSARSTASSRSPEAATRPGSSARRRRDPDAGGRAGLRAVAGVRAAGRRCEAAADRPRRHRGSRPGRARRAAGGAGALAGPHERQQREPRRVLPLRRRQRRADRGARPAGARAAAAGGRAGPDRAHRVRGRLDRWRRSATSSRRAASTVSWPPFPSGDAEMIWTDGRDQRRRPVPVHAAAGASGEGRPDRRRSDRAAPPGRARPARRRRRGRDLRPRPARARARWPAATGRGATSAGRRCSTARALDALFVCTPPVGHAEPAVAALARGLAVYVEKPLARSEEDGAGDRGGMARSRRRLRRRLPVAQPGRARRACERRWRAARRGCSSAAASGRPRAGATISRAPAGTRAAWFTDPPAAAASCSSSAATTSTCRSRSQGPCGRCRRRPPPGRLALADAPEGPLRRRGLGAPALRVGGARRASTSPGRTRRYRPSTRSTCTRTRSRWSWCSTRCFGCTAAPPARRSKQTAAVDPRVSTVDRFLEAVRTGDRRGALHPRRRAAPSAPHSPASAPSISGETVPVA